MPQFTRLLRTTKKLFRLLLVFGLVCATAALAGCAGTKHPASVLGGDCKIFVGPPTEVRGETTADQTWIDETVETGVEVCGWQRPAARPLPPPPVTTTKPKLKKVATKKRHWWNKRKKEEPPDIQRLDQ